MRLPALLGFGGARRMLEDGLCKRLPKPDFALALHVDANAPTGTLTANPGIRYSSSASVDITIHGVGGTPQQAFDAAKAGGPPVAGHHSPLFKVDPEPSMRPGTEAMTVAVPDLLKPAAP